jgi:hypothetical protein
MVNGSTDRICGARSGSPEPARRSSTIRSVDQSAATKGPAGRARAQNQRSSLLVGTNSPDPAGSCTALMAPGTRGIRAVSAARKVTATKSPIVPRSSKPMPSASRTKLRGPSAPIR